MALPISAATMVPRELESLLGTILVHAGHLCKVLNQTTSEIFESHLPNDCPTLVEFYLPRIALGTAFSLVLLLYLFYYRLVLVAKPMVVCSDSARLAALRRHCPVFFEEFRPTVWAVQAYMQTIIRAAIQTFPRSERRREVLWLSDGGHICLDWYCEGSHQQPTILMLPGITGSSDENYIRHWIQDITKLGYRSVVLNYRGCGNTKLSTTKLYCGADISDLTEALEHITTVLPHSPLMAVGVSMGSMLLIKYISECKRQGKNCPIRALLLISTLWNVKVSDAVVHHPLNKYTLSRHLCNNFKGILWENKAVFVENMRRGELCFNFDRAMKCNNLHDLGVVVTLPMFGYKTVDELYRDCSPHIRLEDLSIPVLSLNAADDPFCPDFTIPKEAAMLNPNLILVTTKRGGHIGFIEGLLPVGKTLMDRVLVQFANAVFNHEDFLPK